MVAIRSSTSGHLRERAEEAGFEVSVPSRDVSFEIECQDRGRVIPHEELEIFGAMLPILHEHVEIVESYRATCMELEVFWHQAEL